MCLLIEHRNEAQTTERMCVYVCREMVSQPRLPPQTPCCSFILLFLLIVSNSVNAHSSQVYRSSYWSSTPPPTHTHTHLQAQVREEGGPAAGRWTVIRGEKTRASGQEFWREDRQKTKEGWWGWRREAVVAADVEGAYDAAFLVSWDKHSCYWFIW